MDLDAMIPYLFIGFLLLAASAFFYRVVKYGGFRAAVFGAPINTTLGEVKWKGPKVVQFVIRVHRLGRPAKKPVGLEFVAKGFLFYQILPFALSIGDARKLVSLVEAATEGIESD